MVFYGGGRNAEQIRGLTAPMKSRRRHVHMGFRTGSWGSRAATVRIGPGNTRHRAAGARRVCARMSVSGRCPTTAPVGRQGKHMVTVILSSIQIGRAHV